MSERPIVRREGRVAGVTLNRPEARHALDSELCAAILRALGEAKTEAMGPKLVDTDRS
jgi:enoyl-CoA hydratase/carnithine racemase